MQKLFFLGLIITNLSFAEISAPYGVGSESCQEYIRATESLDNEKLMSIQQWILGYATGRNLGISSDDEREIHMHTQTHCGLGPNLSIIEATEKSLNEMRTQRKRGRRLGFYPL